MTPSALGRVALGASGVEVSRLVLGCASIGGLFAAMSEEQAHAVLESAWTAGVRSFDTAPHYGVGLSEERLGRFLAEKSGAQVTVSSKVGRLLVDTEEDVEGVESFYGTPRRRRVRDLSRSGVRRSVEESCARLGRSWLDVALIHDPEGHERQALDEAFPALVGLREEGVVKAIGIGTNHHSVASWFVERAELDCLLIAGEYSLLGAPAAEALFPLCRERSVAVLVAGVYKSGILADPRPGIHVDYRPAEPEIIARVNQMRVVCERHGVPLAAVALQFVAAHPAVDAVVVGAATAEEAGSNVDYLSLPVPPELFAELAEHERSGQQGLRRVVGGWLEDPRLQATTERSQALRQGRG